MDVAYEFHMGKFSSQVSPPKYEKGKMFLPDEKSLTDSQVMKFILTNY